MEDPKRKEKINAVLSEIKSELSKIDQLKSDFESVSAEEKSPVETRQLIEDIVVPPLEVLSDKKKEKETPNS